MDKMESIIFISLNSISTLWYNIAQKMSRNQNVTVNLVFVI